MAAAPDRTNSESQTHRENETRQSKSSAGSAPHAATEPPTKRNTQRGAGRLQEQDPELTATAESQDTASSDISTSQIINQLQRTHISTNNRTLANDIAQAQAEQERQWERVPYVTVTLNKYETGQYIKELLGKAILYYFTDYPPSYDAFSSWVDTTLVGEQGWPVNQVKYVGRNFFLVTFSRKSHRQAALACAPWYFGRRFVHVLPWHIDFNVHNQYLIEVPIWIELPFLDLIYEPHRYELVSQLGQIIHYKHGDVSRYPHDRACIIWDTRRVKPEKVQVIIDRVVLWQDIIFQTFPRTCSICRSEDHKSFECPNNPIWVPRLYNSKEDLAEHQSTQVENREPDRHTDRQTLGRNHRLSIEPTTREETQNLRSLVSNTKQTSRHIPKVPTESRPSNSSSSRLRQSNSGRLKPNSESISQNTGKRSIDAISSTEKQGDEQSTKSRKITIENKTNQETEDSGNRKERRQRVEQQRTASHLQKARANPQPPIPRRLIENRSYRRPLEDITNRQGRSSRSKTGKRHRESKGDTTDRQEKKQEISDLAEVDITHPKFSYTKLLCQQQAFAAKQKEPQPLVARNHPLVDKNSSYYTSTEDSDDKTQSSEQESVKIGLSKKVRKSRPYTLF
jgi:hypothetical protein